MLSDYLFTPKDGWRLLRRFKMRDVLGVLVLMFAVILVSYFTSISFQDAAFLAFMVALFYWRIDSRVSIGFALACLVLVPIFMYLANDPTSPITEDMAQALAVWAFYFLSIGVVKQVWEYAREANPSARLRAFAKLRSDPSARFARSGQAEEEAGREETTLSVWIPDQVRDDTEEARPEVEPRKSGSLASLGMTEKLGMTKERDKSRKIKKTKVTKESKVTKLKVKSKKTKTAARSPRRFYPKGIK